jgi:predicted alpha/beta hydrolase family esterase
VPTVLLPGPIGNSDQDWQHWLAGQLSAAGREVRTASFPVAESSDLRDWLDELRRNLSGLPADGFDVLAHSAACIVWLHHATEWAGAGSSAADSPRPSRVALVAPPAAGQPMPGWDFLFPAPLDVDALRRAADGTVLVGGDDDPYCPGGVARVYGAPLKMAATVIPGGGSLTAASGFGPWPAVLDWCGRDNLAFIA